MSRIKVEPVRAWDGHIQGWAVNRGGRELAYFLVGWPDARVRALNVANYIAQLE